jgi:hydrogenase expression/formation protein HypC
MCLAVPGKIVEVYQSGGLRMAKVDFGGAVREACLEYVPEAQVGDYTVIHVGFAISRLSEEEAQASLELLRAVMEAEEAAPASEQEQESP